MRHVRRRCVLINFQKILDISYEEILKDDIKNGAKGKEAREKFEKWVDEVWVKEWNRNRDSAEKHFINDMKRWAKEEYDGVEKIRDKKGGTETLRATRVEMLGKRGTERKTPWGEYVCYQTPEGYDFMKYQDLFIDEYVCGKDGTVWKEMKWTKDFIEYKQVMPHKNGKRAVLYTSLDFKRRTAKIERRFKKTTEEHETKKLIYETFTPGVNAYKMKLKVKDGNEENVRYENICEDIKEPRVAFIEPVKWKEITKLTDLTLSIVDKYDWELRGKVEAENEAIMALEKALVDYKKEKGGSLRAFVKQRVEWRLNRLSGKMVNEGYIIDHYESDDELERMIYGDFGEEN